MFSLEKSVLSTPREPTRKTLFTKARSVRTRGDGFKLKESSFRLHGRKKLFTMRVMRHWHRLPRETTDAISLEVYNSRQDEALSNLVYWKVSLTTPGGLN